MLLGVVSVLLPRLFGSTMRVFSDAPAARDEIVRYEAMLKAMRSDVWNAREMKIDKTSCRITQGNGQTPQWRIDRAENSILITRTLRDEPRTWRLSSFNRMSFSSRADG